MSHDGEGDQLKQLALVNLGLTQTVTGLAERLMYIEGNGGNG